MRVNFQVHKHDISQDGGYYYVHKKGDIFDSLNFKCWSNMDLDDKEIAVVQSKIDELQDDEFLEINFTN